VPTPPGADRVGGAADLKNRNRSCGLAVGGRRVGDRADDRRDRRHRARTVAREAVDERRAVRQTGRVDTPAVDADSPGERSDQGGHERHVVDVPRSATPTLFAAFQERPMPSG
jgi:hypothetical protein